MTYDTRMSAANSIRDACLVGAAELSVRVVTPFSLPDGQGLPVEFITFFPDFGGPNGTVVCHLHDWLEKHGVAESHGFNCSGLHADSYGQFNREQFVEAFNEWGWRGGASNRPAWCSG